jgi:hypothetical protein
MDTTKKLGMTLGRWAALGKALQEAAPVQVPWEPAARMVAAAEKDADVAAQILGALLKNSSADTFPGLGDPLEVDFGAHRWLRGAREESYSDWLAWIINRQAKSERILPLFGIEAGALAGKTCSADRECCTPRGRLDLVINCDESAVLAVEIKTSSEPDDEQLKRYLALLKQWRDSLGLVLLAIDLPENLGLGDWTFCSWRDVSVRLRRWASIWLAEGRLMDAAMTLAFCGAVEQNLLGFSSDGISAPAMAEYLEEWLEKYRNAEDR